MVKSELAVKQNMNYIDLGNVETISRGDATRRLKYLNQFKELIPERLDQLQSVVADQNRFEVRRIVHQMSPQIQFFGISGITPLIQQLELEYETISLEDLKAQVAQIIGILEKSLAEVSQLIDTYTK